MIQTQESPSQLLQSYRARDKNFDFNNWRLKVVQVLQKDKSDDRYYLAEILENIDNN